MDRIKTIRAASDKSISHRAALLSSIADESVIIKNYLFAEDTVNTLKTLMKLGVDVKTFGSTVIINPKGKYAFKEPDEILDVGNSGTAMRLFSGILSAQPFLSVLTGDGSLIKRPMMRIIEPLTSMGSMILSRHKGLAPLAIYGTRDLLGINYDLKIASAQVKSAILLAGLFSKNEVCINEPVKSRTHTENMLKAFGVDVIEDGNSVCLGKDRELKGSVEINVPADISSSAFFMVLTALKNNFEVLFKDVILNKTRTGILNVFSQCGINYEIADKKIINNEEIGDIFVKYSKNLKPFTINGDLVPSLIDEIPILSILGVFCDGVSTIKGAAELRKKESDRIGIMCRNLSNLGVKIEEFDDGFKIYGNPKIRLNSAEIETNYDHRVAMSFLILKAIKDIDITIDGIQSIKTSYPGFFDHLNYLMF